MKSFFTTRPLMKLMAVVLAFFLWTFVHSEQRVDLSLKVAVQLKNKPEDLVISGEWERFIKLGIAGPRSRVRGLTDESIGPYDVDLKAEHAGVTSIRVYEDDFKIPYGARITRITPQVIRITLDRAEERLMRIRPLFMGELEEGFELSSYDVIPPYVKIKGPRKDLASLSALETEPISLSGRHENFQGEFHVRYPEGIAEQKEVKVAVKVVIREREVSRILEDIPVKVAGVNETVRVVPAKVNLRVRGPAGMVASLMEEKLEVEIDAKKLGLLQNRKKTYRIRPIPPTRPGIEITMIPDNVLVTLAQE
ncbi:MAG TPA: CdaR family protein [Bdellovibrionota bacterium]|nr:CdaR family protein [Bdellovibrionota bacterium]